MVIRSLREAPRENKRGVHICDGTQIIEKSRSTKTQNIVTLTCYTWKTLTENKVATFEGDVTLTSTKKR